MKSKHNTPIINLNTISCCYILYSLFASLRFKKNFFLEIIDLDELGYKILI